MYKLLTAKLRRLQQYRASVNFNCRCVLAFLLSTPKHLVYRLSDMAQRKKKMRKPPSISDGHEKWKKKKNEGEREKSFCACEYVCVCLCKIVASARDCWRYLLRKERRITIVRQSVVCGRGKVGAVVCGMQARTSPSGSLHHRSEGQVEVKPIFCCSRLQRTISRNWKRFSLASLYYLGTRTSGPTLLVFPFLF